MAELYTKLFIDGKWRSSKAGKTFAVVNPTTEEKIADVDEAGADDIDIAFAAAQKAFPAWRDLSAWERINRCLKLADLIEKSADELAQLDSMNMGMPLALSRQFIIPLAVSTIKYTTSMAHEIHGETTLNTPGLLSFTLRQPFGVCAGITPWNGPITMWIAKVIPCVVAGNTIILKSSEKAPLSSLKLGALAHEAGFPPGVINVLSGPGQIGALLASHPGIRKISFTGSTATGKAVMAAAAASNMKRVSLECGGKNPAVVFDDADIPNAALATAANLQFNSGQVCISNSRIYVQKGAYSQFVEEFTKVFTAVKMGDPLDTATNFGPQVDKKQFDNILRLIDEAKQDGANLIAGGSRATETEKGYFIQPTIFSNIPKGANLLKTEVFGSVAAIQEFETEEEVLALANDTEYGLSASVYTKDISRGIRFAKAFEAGIIGINAASHENPYNLPFGGWKQSGIGREKDKSGLESWYEVKAVTIKHS
ncbi:hypothetical protein NQ176_g3434 [Zarea fungicola]|uniref:Uncharacterized protein n=1 Tax=Zarea fungicola TaxID=93591 RepID=A0ACC1NKK4_9HYPO|nr:hypothetical protein NQ176_g3434 [Lecanicillium fungicola]